MIAQHKCGGHITAVAVAIGLAFLIGLRSSRLRDGTSRSAIQPWLTESWTCCAILVAIPFRVVSAQNPPVDYYRQTPGVVQNLAIGDMLGADFRRNTLNGPLPTANAS
jgi:hypothetical protein